MHPVYEAGPLPHDGDTAPTSRGAPGSKDLAGWRTVLILSLVLEIQVDVAVAALAGDLHAVGVLADHVA